MPTVELSDLGSITDPLAPTVLDSCGHAPVDLVPHEPTVAAVADLLRRVCDVMGGRIQRSGPSSRPSALGPRLHKASIRSGIHAAVAECTTRFKTEMTVAFFPNQERKRKQLKMYDRNGMADFMPHVSDDFDAERFTDPESGCSVYLPAHFYVDRCTTLDEALAACVNPRDRLQELFTIAQHLTKQLLTVHRRNVVLRDICRANVVRTSMGAQRGWTLLEYGSASRAHAKSESVPIRRTPPELAKDRLDNKPLVIVESFDMWQLGVLLYEICTGHSYWPDTMTVQQVLHVLAEPSELLPHESVPAPVDLVQHILGALLTRDANKRLTSAEFKQRLDEEEETGTLAATINSGRAHQDGDVHLQP